MTAACRPRVGLATTRPLPEPDPDEFPLVAALEREGCSVRLLPWRDSAAPSPEDFDLVVLRSTWDYSRAGEAFRAWLVRVAAATRLLNPLPVVEWNLHKRYLLELGAAGVPVVPTRLRRRGESAAVGAAWDEFGAESIVVKPAVSAASRDTRRFDRSELEAADAFAAALLRKEDVLLQPFLPAFADPGERAVVCFDGRPHHVVVKRPRFADDAESVGTGRPPTAAESAFAAEVLARVPFESARPLLYARVDAVADSEAPYGLRLSELELVEPSLFLTHQPGAVSRFARAVAARAGAAVLPEQSP